MFNKEDAYLNATKDAQIYTSVAIKSRNKKIIIVNVLLFAFLASATLYYVQNNTNVFSKKAVLGVSETIDFIEENEKKYTQGDLSNSMKVLMTEPTIKSKSSYSEAIARELDDKSGFRGRIAVVKHDETISSVSKTY